MAPPDDTFRTRLPPPPAPTHRSANPWRFSRTARKREVARDTPIDEPSGAEPVRGPGQAAGRNLLPLVFFALAAAVVLRELYETRDTGEWVTAIAPLVVILLMAVTWWRRRHRRGDGEEGG